MRRGYIPPGDTPNLKYWDPTEVYLKSNGSFRFSPSRTHVFNYFTDHTGWSPWRTRDNPDSDVFVMGMAGSHLFYIVHGGIYTDIYNHHKFSRLRRVSNLGVTKIEIIGANHGRDQHSIVAGIMAELVLRRNGFSEHDVNVGIAAGLLHDVATPVYSDYGKLACPEELDEEKNIELIIGNFDEIFRKYGIEKQEVVDAIRGQGSVGKLINSKGVDLDKIAYTAIDFDRTYRSDPWGRMRVFRRDPYLFDIHEDIEIVDGQPVFTDPQKLFRFLYLRALMFENVHFSGANRAREAHLKRILQDLWKRGKINKKQMLESDDGWFLHMLEKEIGRDIFEFQSVSFPIVEVGRYQTVEEAQKAHEGDDVIIDKWRTFNPATGTLIIHGGQKKFGRTVGGNILPFREVFPKQAGLVEQISRDQEYVGVYKRGEDSPTNPELLRHFRYRSLAEGVGVPRKILSLADVETPERIIWALEQIGRKDEAQKMRERLEGEPSFA